MYKNPYERTDEEVAIDWLESADNQAIINTYLEEAKDPTSPWHLAQIKKEVEDRELWPYINAGEDK